MSSGGTAPPRRRDDIELRSDGDGSMLIRTDGTRIVALNDTAAALWELCDGRTSVDEMVDAITILFDAQEEQVRADVADAIGQLASAGLLVDH